MEGGGGKAGGARFVNCMFVYLESSNSLEEALLLFLKCKHINFVLSLLYLCLYSFFTKVVRTVSCILRLTLELVTSFFFFVSE